MFIISKVLNFLKKFSIHLSNYASVNYRHLSEPSSQPEDETQGIKEYLSILLNEYRYYFSFLPQNLSDPAPESNNPLWQTVLFFPVLGVWVGIAQFLKAFVLYSQDSFLKTLAFLCNPFLDNTSFKNGSYQNLPHSLFFGIFGYLMGFIVGNFIIVNVLLISNLYALTQSFLIHLFKGLSLSSMELYLSEEGLNRPVPYLGYYLAVVPGLLVGGLLSNIVEFSKSLPMVWNRVNFDRPQLQFATKANESWWTLPGRVYALVSQMILFMPLFSIRLVIDTLHGIFQGIQQSYLQLKLYIGDIEDSEYQPVQPKNFHSLGQYLGILVGFPIALVKLLMWDGFLINGVENFKQLCGLAYHYAFWDHIENEKINLIDKNLSKWQKFKKIVLGSVGGTLGFVVSTVIWPVVSFFRVLSNTGKGLRHGFLQGHSQVLVSQPFEFLNQNLLSDESEYQKQWMIFGAIFSVVPGILVGTMHRLTS